VNHDTIKTYYEQLYRDKGDAAFACDRERYASWFARLPHEPMANATALDIGCGVGIVADYLASRGYRVTGTEISDTALQIARKRVPEARFTAASSNGLLPFADNTFDLVTCLGVLEHIPDAPRLVAEACRVLKPSGQALFVVPNRSSPYFFFGRGTGQIEEKPRSLACWSALFADSGFIIGAVARDPGPTPHSSSRLALPFKTILNRALGRLSIRLTYQFVFVLLRPGAKVAGERAAAS
jgi:2-polyprenyl-3-methyl-5-hydroxy-6-metoxy-1,4-benzoquinol methylase